MDGQELLRLSVECFKSLRSKYPFIKLPPKANGRLGFHESAILLLRQDMATGNHPCRYSLPNLVCPALHYFSQDLGKQQTKKQGVVVLYPKNNFLSRHR